MIGVVTTRSKKASVGRPGEMMRADSLHPNPMHPLPFCACAYGNAGMARL